MDIDIEKDKPEIIKEAPKINDIEKNDPIEPKVNDIEENK